MEAVTPESFEEWKYHPVTKKVMKLLLEDREVMKEGLVSNAYENEDDVKGRCKAIEIILSLDYEGLYNE